MSKSRTEKPIKIFEVFSGFPSETLQESLLHEL